MIFKESTKTEKEAKFVQDRIISVEKHLAELCYIFGQYTRKIARVRDKGDELSNAIVLYSEDETINASLARALASFANTFSVINDYGNIRVVNIEKNVVSAFSQYENICKHTKGEVKHIFNARVKEINKKKQLDKVRERNPANRQQIIQAETELMKATAEVSKSVNNLEEHVTAFERQKLHDIKTIFLDFITIEMSYHAKSIEILTKAFQEMDSIDETADLEEFKKFLHAPKEQSRPEPRRNLFSSQSLGSINTLFVSSNRRRSPGIPRPLPRVSKQAISKSEETLDSIKHTITDSSESDSSQEANSENVESEEKPPAFVARKYLK